MPGRIPMMNGYYQQDDDTQIAEYKRQAGLVKRFDNPYKNLGWRREPHYWRTEMRANLNKIANELAIAEGLKESVGMGGYRHEPLTETEAESIMRDIELRVRGEQ